MTGTEEDTRIKVVAEVVGKEIHLQAPYDQRERCQSIPGAKWGGRRQVNRVRAYVLPATTNAVVGIKRAFPSEEFRRVGNKEFAELAKRAREAEAAQAHKTRDSLPDFPGRTEGWLHQRQAYWFAEALDAACLAMDMGCLTGDAVVTVNRAGNSRQMRLDQLVESFNKRGKLNRTQGVWDESIPTYVRGLKQDGTLGLVPLVAALDNGVKKVVRVVLASGKSVTCTRDHEIVTPAGKVHACKLSPGDEVLTNGSRDGAGYVWLYLPDHPNATTGGQVLEHQKVMSDHLGRPIAKGEVVHHKNEIPDDNRLENLELCESQAAHLRLHHSELRGNLPGVSPLVDVVLAVEDAGEEKVYDLSVLDDTHTYVANGIVVGNTGKSKVVVGLAEGWNCNRVLILCPAKAVDVWPTQFNGPLEVPDPKIVPCPICEGVEGCPVCEGKGEWLDETLTKELPYGHGKRKWEVLALDKTQGTVKKRTLLAKEAYERASDKHPVVIVMNYEAAILEPFKKWALSKPWDLVDLDESHKIKAPGGVTSRFCTSLGKRAQKRLCNTGTPMPHSPLDVYAQYRFLDAAIFGTSHHRFKQRFAVMGGFEGKEVKGLQNEDELSQLFASIAYMCDADDVLDLPPAMPPERRLCVLGKDATRIYNELDTELVADVGAGIVTAQNALTRLLRLQQATSGHTKTDEDERIVVLGEEKKKLLWDVLADLSPREPVVVFTRFKHDIRVVREVCAEQERRVGEVSGDANDLVNAKFPKDKDLLGVQMQSGGTGVDLTRACYAIYYSVGFSLGDYLQSLKRIHRPGQTRASHFYHLVAEKEGERPKDRATVDQVVYEALKAREDVVKRVLAAAKERGVVPA